MIQVWRVLLVVMFSLPSVYPHSKQFQLLRNVLTTSMDNLEKEQESLRGDILAEVQSILLPSAQISLKQEILTDVRREMQNTFLSRPRQPVSVDLRDVQQLIEREVQKRMDGSLRNDLRQELLGEMRSQIQNTYQSRPRQPMPVDINREVKQEIQREVTRRMGGSFRNDLRQELLGEMRSQIQNSYQSQPRQPMPVDINREVKQEIQREVQRRMDGSFRNDLRQDLLEQMRAQIQNTFQSQPRQPITVDVNREVKQEIQREVQRRMDGSLRNDLRQELLGEMRAQIQNVYQSRPRQSIAVDINREVKQEIQREVQNRVESSLRNKLREDILSEVREQLQKSLLSRPRQPAAVDINRNIRQEIQREVQKRLDGPIRNNIREDILLEVQKQIQTALQSQQNQLVRADFNKDIKQEIQREVRKLADGSLKNTIQKDLLMTVQDQIQDEINKGLASFLRGSLKEELSKELRQDIKNEIQSRLVGYLQDSLSKEVMKKLQSGVIKVETKLTPYRRRILKQDIMKEVKRELGKSNMTGMSTVGKEDMMREVRNEVDKVHRKDGMHDGIRDEIMKDVKQEMTKIQRKGVIQNDEMLEEVRGDMEILQQKIRQTEMELKNLGKTSKSTDATRSDREMREYVTMMTEKVQEDSNMLKKDFESYRKSYQMLTRKVRQLERKLGGLQKQMKMYQEASQDKTTSVPTSPPSESKYAAEFERPIPTIIPGFSILGNVVQGPGYDEETPTSTGLRPFPRPRPRPNLSGKDSLLVVKQNHSDVMNVDLASGSYSTFSLSLGKYVGDVSYDPVGKTIFWSDWRIDAIYMYFYNTKDPEPVLLKSNTLSYGLEVDAEKRVVVCSNYWSREIFTIDTDTGRDSSRSIKRIAKINGGNPMRLAVDFPSKKIYVVVSYTKIYQVNYKNGKTRSLVEIDRSFIHGLGVNPDTKILYFNNFTSLMAKDVTKRRQKPFRVAHITGKEPSDVLVHNGDVYIAYYNSEDVDVLRDGQSVPDLYTKLPFTPEQHLRVSMCFVTAH